MTPEELWKMNGPKRRCKFCGKEVETQEQKEAGYCDARCKVGAMSQWV